jgi:hypothetical protein
MNKSIESDYHYEYTGPVQTSGAKELAPVGTEGGAPLPIQDQLTPSLQPTKPIKIPLIDAPELPIPTAKAVRISEVKKAITKELENNPAFTGKNYLGMLVAKYFEYMKNMSETRFNESQMAQLVERYIFELGKENAEFAKLLKDQAATKEFINAVNHFVNAGISFIQFGVTLKERGAARREAGEDPSIKPQKEHYDKTLKEKNEQLKELNEQCGAADRNPQQALTDEQKRAKTERQKVQSDVEEFEKKKVEVQAKEDELYHRILQQKARESDPFMQALKSLSEASARVATGLVTLEEGKIEKNKIMNETILQVLNKLDDGIRKSKDDLQAQVDKILQSLTQTIADTIRAHQVSRG